MLRARTNLDRDGVRLAAVSCRHGKGRGRETECTDAHAVVFVRRGCFVRSVDGHEDLLDPTAAYCMNPGEEQRYDHPHADGDDCTWLSLDAALVASLWGDDPTLPSGSLASSPCIDLEQRMLLAAARRGGDPHELVERAIAVADGANEDHAVAVIAVVVDRFDLVRDAL
ncbi:MAG: hypothetical protein GEU88_19965, partial [Solirubrobacterales bacterium]|nr:hypothetical protein [Solirubrobacterales bacterium]